MAALSKVFHHRGHEETAQHTEAASPLPRWGRAPGTRSSYTAQEWRTLEFAYLWAFAAVMGDDAPLTIQPGIGGAPFLRDSPLARDVIVSLQADLDGVKKKFEHDPRTAHQGLSDVADLLDRTVTAPQAQQFKVAVAEMMRQIFEGLKAALAEARQDQSAEGRQYSELLEDKIPEAGFALAVMAASLRLVA